MIHMRKRYPDFRDNVKRIAIVFILIIISVFVIDAFGNFCLSLAFEDYNPYSDRSRMLLPILLISVMVIAIYEAIYFYVELQNSIREEEQNKQAIIQSQLDALQNQSRPHFLFNSLNTLRDIIDQESKDDATKFVDKLSDVYRFILDSKDDNLIPLRKEIKFGKSYFHVQSERFGDNLSITWNIKVDVLDKFIAPLSLQLLLENAIKHNIISKSKPLSIDVFSEDNNLIVRNNIQLKSSNIASTQLGLKNIEKRYALLSEKTIVIHDDGDFFKVSIPLLISSDQRNSYANTDH